MRLSLLGYLNLLPNLSTTKVTDDSSSTPRMTDEQTEHDRFTCASALYTEAPSDHCRPPLLISANCLEYAPKFGTNIYQSSAVQGAIGFVQPCTTPLYDVGLGSHRGGWMEP